MPNQPKINLALALGLILTIAIASIAIGYFYIQNTMLTNRQILLESQISELQSEIDTLQLDYENLNTQYEKTQLSKTTSYQSGYESGYAQGIDDGAGSGYNIRDPTYQEALQFIASDQTDKNQYDENTYNCHDYTANVKNNAFEGGYRSGYVYIEFREGVHALVAFDTVDQGMIYIEPQDDNIMTLTVGQPYWDRTLYEVTYDDTIVRFTVIW